MANALDTWFEFLKDRPLPVQAAIALRVQQTLNRAIASHHDFAEILRYGPGMSIELFRSLRRLPEPPRNPIETLTHAVAMLGLEPLQLATLRMPSIDRLAEEAIPGLRLCFGRAIQSAYFAQCWAEMRRFSNPEAIGLAALMDECAEMALWTNAPEQMLAINRLRAQGSTSNDASLQVLGVSLNRLSLRLAEYWFLPPLTIESLRNNVYEARPLCVLLATHLVRTIDSQWVNPKSTLVLELVQEFLNTKPDKLLALVHRQAAEVARAAQFTGLPMAIHHLPFVTEIAPLKTHGSRLPPPRLVKKRAPLPPLVVPEPENPEPEPPKVASTRAPDFVLPPPSMQSPLEGRGSNRALRESHSKPESPKPEIQAGPAQESAPHPSQNQGGSTAVGGSPPLSFIKAVEQLLGIFHHKMGLTRCLYARQDEAGFIKQELLIGLETEPLRGFKHQLGGTLFFALMQKPVGLWLNGQNRHRYRSLIPKDAGDWSDKESFMMALFCDNQPMGLIYADKNGEPLSEKDFLRFKTATEKFSQVMTQTKRCPLDGPVQ
jgi:HD-like signal output (HDOD) protein